MGAAFRQTCTKLPPRSPGQREAVTQCEPANRTGSWARWCSQNEEKEAHAFSITSTLASYSDLWLYTQLKPIWTGLRHISQHSNAQTGDQTYQATSRCDLWPKSMDQISHCLAYCVVINISAKWLEFDSAFHLCQWLPKIIENQVHSVHPDISGCHIFFLTLQMLSIQMCFLCMTLLFHLWIAWTQRSASLQVSFTVACKYWNILFCNTNICSFLQQRSLLNHNRFPQ